MVFAEKRYREKSARRQKIKHGERCRWDPSAKDLGDIIHTRKSDGGKGIQKCDYSPRTPGNGRQAPYGCTMKMVHLASSLLPQPTSPIQGFHRKFRICIPGCTHLHLQIQQLNPPVRVQSFQPPPFPIPTHGTKLLRTQEARFREQ